MIWEPWRTCVRAMLQMQNSWSLCQQFSKVQPMRNTHLAPKLAIILTSVAKAVLCSFLKSREWSQQTTVFPKWTSTLCVQGHDGSYQVRRRFLQKDVRDSQNAPLSAASVANDVCAGEAIPNSTGDSRWRQLMRPTTKMTAVWFRKATPLTKAHVKKE